MDVWNLWALDMCHLGPLALITHVGQRFGLGSGYSECADSRAVWGYVWGVVVDGAALALVALVISVFLQRDELSTAKEELKNAKDELNLMNANMARQSRESMFFQLLGYYRDCAFNMKIETKIATKPHAPPIIEKVDAFPHWADDLLCATEQIKSLAEAYFDFLKNTPELMRYHLVVLALLRFLCKLDKEASGDEFETYVSTFRSQITEEELWLIIWHTCMPSVPVDYVDLIKTSGILNDVHLDKEWAGTPLLGPFLKAPQS